MAAIITWTILTMEYDTSTSPGQLIVTSAIQANDGIGYARKVYQSKLSGVVGPPPLTPYSQLTEAQVIALVQADLGPFVVADGETYVTTYSAIKKQQIEDIGTNSGLPWQPPVDPVG